MIFELIFVFIFYLLVVILSTYYVDLFLSKDEFTKEELRSIMPYLQKYAGRIASNYSLPMFFLVLFFSSLFGLAFPMIIQTPIGNSAIFFVIIFLLFPHLKKHYLQSQVSTHDHYADTLKNIFLKYCNIIIIGFGAGSGTALIYNLRPLLEIHFLWFLVNIIVISILLGMTVLSEWREQ